MSPSVTDTVAPESAKREEAAHLVGLPLKLADHAGRAPRGRAIFLPKLGDAADNLHLVDGEEFRILILAEPPEGPLVPAEGIVVSAPARPLSSARAPQWRTSKPARHAALPLTSDDLELLRPGRLFASAPLQVTAEHVFAGGRARLALLARDLLVSQAMSDYPNPIAITLGAPETAQPATSERLEEL